MTDQKWLAERDHVTRPPDRVDPRSPAFRCVIGVFAEPLGSILCAALTLLLSLGNRRGRLCEVIDLD